MDEAAVSSRLLDLLDGMHRYQIWRVAGAGALTSSVLRRADMVYVVTTGTLASLAAAQHMFDWLATNNPRALTLQIFNAVSPRMPLSPIMISQVTGRESKMTIPWKKGVGQDLASSIPLHETRHSLNREFRAIADQILGNTGENGKRGIFGFWSR